jgi:hypothetical protein
MNPILKIFLKILAITVLLMFAVQINNLYCVNFNKCRPFFFSYYYTKLNAKKYQNITFITNYKLINTNKNIDVTLDFDKTYSKISQITKVKIIYKNLTNNKIVIKNNFSYQYEIFSKFITMFKCPCSSKIILKPKESKIVEIEFFYHQLVSQNTKNDFAQFLLLNANVSLSNQINQTTSITNNLNLLVN